MRYERTQQAYWMWILLLIPALFILVAWTLDPRLAMALPVSVVLVPLLLAGAIFTRLTIAVDANTLRWHFGWGWPGGSIAMADIARAETTQTNLLEGWGIHWTIWHGWLWNVSGFQAVEIFKNGGGSITLGTQDPQGLAQAIQRFGARA
jgi:hypothetical protein